MFIIESENVNFKKGFIIAFFSPKTDSVYKNKPEFHSFLVTIFKIRYRCSTPNALHAMIVPT